MAKPRKQKNGEQKPENSGAVVRHQKLCVSIDMDKQCLYGYTELKIIVPESGVVGLHADNMNIDKIYVDGEPADYEFFPHYQHVEDERRWHSINCPSSASDAACYTYISSLDKEMASNLLILCNKSIKSSCEGHTNGNMGNSVQNPSAEFPQVLPTCNGHTVNENVKLVRIEYWVDKAETGIHFKDNVLHTDNQIRRAHCWFPCIDNNLQRCCYDLEFTVDSKLVAVSNGILLYQVLSKDDPPRKTYVYKLNVPVAAECISLAVAPFEIFPDRHNGAISHMCLPAYLSKLRNTVGFFYSAFSHYEDYLSASFPFGSYKQVFITAEMAISSLNLGASMSMFSSQVLFDEKVIDQTFGTRIKLAYALARQWFGMFITAERPNDGWLLEGLAGFLTDTFIKRSLGNNEARYRRYKTNCAVCKADIDGATALSSSAASSDLYGTQSIGLLGKVRAWKAVAVLQMLEKQMGPESFRKILQIIIYRAQDKTRSLRALSTKEFRHFANKVGNLERPFLKEFFPRWVESCGCPVLRMGFSYNKRRNMIELAALRRCSTTVTPLASVGKDNPDSNNRECDVGWPGMMSIRVHELDGVYDHPSLPMAGEACQLLEIQCHSKLAAKRAPRPKKGSKPDGSDDNGDAVASLDARSGMESPLLWLRVDPEMEYLAEIIFLQPVQMWINQLEKDKDVVAQVQAIAALEASSNQSFAIVHALNNFLCDSKVFWRVRIEAAYALAKTACEETDWAGFFHLVKFYKSRRFDPDIGLPRPNDFHDFPEYFVLEYNDNSGNQYSDVYWMAALVQSIGDLEFGHQTIQYLPSLLKRIDRLMQFDRLMPSYNGILTISCIRTLTQIALTLSDYVSLDRVIELIKPFRNVGTTIWQVRSEASRALLDLEFHSKGLNEALILCMRFIEEESSIRGQVKLTVHLLYLCQIKCGYSYPYTLESSTLVAMLRLLGSRRSFNNVFLRHHLFCALQTLAGRCPTLYGVPKDQIQPIMEMEPSVDTKTKPSLLKLKISRPQDPLPNVPTLSSDVLPLPEVTIIEPDAISNGNERKAPVVKIRVKQGAAPAGSSRLEDENAMETSRGGQPNEAERAGSSSVSVDAPLRVVNELVSVPCQNLEEVNSSHEPGSRMSASIGGLKFTTNEEELGKELQCTADSRKGASHSPICKSIEEVTHEVSSQVHDSNGAKAIAEISHVVSAQLYDLNRVSAVVECHESRAVEQGSEKKGEDERHESKVVERVSEEKEDEGVKSRAAEEDSEKKDEGHDSSEVRQGSVEKKDQSHESREGPEGSVENKDEKKEKKEHKRKREKEKKRDDPEYLERKRLKREKKKRKKEKMGLVDHVTKASMAEVNPLYSKVEPMKNSEPTNLEPKLSLETKPNVESKGEVSGGPVHKLRIKFKGRSIGHVQ
ncbi:hypothetical protein AMTRI_Chr04g188050 [Amborella trichopoda]